MSTPNKQRACPQDQDDAIATQLDLMVDEATNTSLIEGENLSSASVRSSLQNYLSLNPTPINVAEGMAALIVDVRKTSISH